MVGIIDDLSDVAGSKEEAERMLKYIADQDPSQRITFEIDFPNNKLDFIPFLNSEIRINDDGSISSRLFRKPQETTYNTK